MIREQEKQRAKTREEKEKKSETEGKKEASAVQPVHTKVHEHELYM